MRFPGWINGILVAAVTLGAAGVSLAREGAEFTPVQKDHWAWKKPTRMPVPAVRNAAWVRNPIDAFILAKLEAAKLKPAATAAREELIRRVAFDLTGLPPSPAEIDGFITDAAPDAYERMVDRYLASPAYGERWARHWLDLARYADSNGYEHDEVRPDAWRYRDYVVRAFNADKPYNRFIEEQLAGDELWPNDPDARIATGFNLLGPDMTDAADQAARRQNTLNDMTDTAGLTFLGLTVGCARCHDHKYEPILQTDYYRLQAFFAPARFRNDIPVGTPEDLKRLVERTAAYEARLKSLTGQMDALSGPVREQLRAERIAKLPEEVVAAFRTPEKERTVDQQALVDRHAIQAEPPAQDVAERLSPEAQPKYQALADELRKLRDQKPVGPTAMALAEDPTIPAPATYVLGRGEISNREAQVTAGFPVILGGSSPKAAEGTGLRAALARWIASGDNPLTARVLVNRVWQHHFGRAIVPSPSDFGVRGENPTHPELLDWLAGEFTRSGWSLKKLHKLILLSNAYKQSSHAAPETLAGDPENELFSRQNRQRLEAEAVRDAVLSVSGRLNPKMGGPGVFPPLPESLKPEGAAWPVTGDPAEHTRRSLYIFVRRNLHYPALEAFDSPDTNLSCPRRDVSTTAPQALALLNSPEMLRSARAFAGRVLSGAPDETARVTLAYRLALGRKPTDYELKTAREFLASQAKLLHARALKDLSAPDPLPKGEDPYAATAMTDYCLALLNLNEFVYVD